MAILTATPACEVTGGENQPRLVASIFVAEPMTERDKPEQAVAIGPRLLAASGFDALYREGMTLIEDVAQYLDGPGRGESGGLSREASLLYTTESMRLTTRLMQLASWLLLQRAVNEGELTAENARVEKAKVRFSSTPDQRGGPGYSELPGALKRFIEKGDRLFDRVLQLDRMERGVMPEFDPNPVRNDIADQFARLKAAFGRRS